MRVGKQEGWKAGSTLVELVVVLAILGLMFGLSALALTALRQPADQERRQRLEGARRESLKMGVAVMIADDSDQAVRFLPDGRVIGGNLDPLTGKPQRRHEQ